LKKLLLKTAVFYYSSLINGISVFNKKKAAAKAMSVFQTPRGKKLTPMQKSYLESFEKNKLKQSGENIPYYNWKANGNRILLLHGWESSSYRWRPYLKDFNDLNLNVFTVDAPAHGRSTGNKFSPIEYAEVIKTIVEKEKINTILGHSVGAYATIIYASENKTPSHLKKLILLAPTGKLRDFMKQFFDFLNINTKVRLAFEENFKKTFNQPLDYFDSDNLIKKVTVGGFLIHDKEDKTLPFKDSIDISKNWKDSSFIETQGYGHRLKGQYIKDLIIKSLKSNS